MAASKLPVLPVTNYPKKRAGGLFLHPVFYITCWIFFSNLTILFNKWLLDTAGFRYPVILTCWHMVFASLATQCLARTTSLLDGRHGIKMDRKLYVRAVLPIGILYSGSMVCSNLVYLYLNVAFIQMLKAASPFATLVVAWLWRQENPTRALVIKILVIVCGVLLASAGEIHFSWPGFLYQLGGLLFESVRVVMIHALMSGGDMDTDPLVSLYYYAPVCAVTNVLVAGVTDWPSFQWEDLARVGVGMLFLNAFIAFLLNVSSVFLIGKTSGLILHLTGVLKNILLVILAVLIWGTAIAPLQIFGYSVALLGILFYKMGWDEVKMHTMSFSNRYTDASGSTDEKKLATFVRRALFFIALVVVTVIVLRQRPPTGGLFTHAHSSPNSDVEKLPKPDVH